MDITWVNWKGAFSLIFLSILSSIFLGQCQSQSQSNSCSSYLRNTRRMGPNVMGRLEIPTDDFYPRYKLKVGFNTPIHHMTIRQSRASDMGNHQDFIVDPMEMRGKDGKLQLDVFIRLQRLFGPFPRLTRIVYNNEVLCGEALDVSEVEDAFVLETTHIVSTTSTAAPANSSKINGAQLWKTKYTGEDEEDIFLDEVK